MRVSDGSITEKIVSKLQVVMAIMMKHRSGGGAFLSGHPVLPRQYDRYATLTS